jgi:hypothetical protein
MNIREPEVDVEIGAELGPNDPSVVVGVGARRNDAGSARFLRKAEVTEESISFVGCTKRQEHICGHAALKWVRSCSSDK